MSTLFFTVCDEQYWPLNLPCVNNTHISPCNSLSHSVPSHRKYSKSAEHYHNLTLQILHVIVLLVTHLTVFIQIPNAGLLV